MKTQNETPKVLYIPEIGEYYTEIGGPRFTNDGKLAKRFNSGYEAEITWSHFIGTDNGWGKYGNYLPEFIYEDTDNF